MRVLLPMMFVFDLLSYTAIGLPLIIALLARRSPASLRIVLALAGVLSGLLLLVGSLEQSKARTLLPLLTTALSFYVVITGFCSVVTFGYFRSGGALSPAMVLLAAIAPCGLAFGAFVLFSLIKQ